MNDFVEECRREWRRLGVADRLADEMAAELASDLEAAEADGVSAAELLGTSISDPRSFAASWAAERGILPAPSGRGSAHRRPLVLTAFTAVAAITLVVAAIFLLSGNPTVSLVATGAPSGQLKPPPGGVVGPPHVSERVVRSASASAPVEWILLFLAVAGLGFAVWLWSSWGRPRPPGTPESSPER